MCCTGEEYCALYAEHLLVRSVEKQFNAFMRGFLLLCDGLAFSLLTPPELEQLVVGQPHLDFRALQASANIPYHHITRLGPRSSRPAPPPSLRRGRLSTSPPTHHPHPQASAKYDGGFDADHPTVKHLWDVVHSFDAADQRALLFFATGCDRAPIGGLGNLQFIVQRAGPDSMSLPHAHTCFNLLSLPEYTTRAKLRDRLTIAIRNATGFGLQ